MSKPFTLNAKPELGHITFGKRSGDSIFLALVLLCLDKRRMASSFESVLGNAYNVCTLTHVYTNDGELSR